MYSTYYTYSICLLYYGTNKYTIQNTNSIFTTSFF